VCGVCVRMLSVTSARVFKFIPTAHEYYYYYKSKWSKNVALVFHKGSG
jgi:hypothetical protein